MTWIFDLGLGHEYGPEHRYVLIPGEPGPFSEGVSLTPWDQEAADRVDRETRDE